MFFAGSMAWRRQRFLEIAQWHADRESSYQEGRFWFVGSGRVQTLGERNIDPLASYHARLRRKYELAARKPWLSVESDSPAPDR
jgi:hypothetical protein